MSHVSTAHICFVTCYDCSCFPVDTRARLWYWHTCQTVLLQASSLTVCVTFVCHRAMRNVQHKRQRRLQLLPAVKSLLQLLVNQRQCRREARTLCWVGCWSWNQRNWWMRLWVDTCHWVCSTRSQVGCQQRCYRKLWTSSPRLTVEVRQTLNLHQ